MFSITHGSLPEPGTAAIIDSRQISLALVGNPNCGKTALFNRLTGARQKVANYAGVTVDRKEGQFHSAKGQTFQIIDLPGAYSLNALTPDEEITRDVLFGARADEAAPDIIVVVVDATNLRRNLRLVLEVIRLQRPTVLALNMMDMAAKRGLVIDIPRLKAELGIPVVETVAIKADGGSELVAQLEAMAAKPLENFPTLKRPEANNADRGSVTQKEIVRILDVTIKQEAKENLFGDKLDAIVLHPVLGYVILMALLFLVFQAVFSWSKLPMDLIKDGVTAIGSAVQSLMPEGILRSLIVDGILSGVGSVIVFLPQILILFLFILVLEESFSPACL